MYVYAEDVIFDACAGAELGTKGSLVYLKSIIDSSTEEEMTASFFYAALKKFQFKPRNYTLK